MAARREEALAAARGNKAEVARKRRRLRVGRNGVGFMGRLEKRNSTPRGNLALRLGSPISAGDFEVAGGREAVAADGFAGVAVCEEIMNAVPQARQRLGGDKAQAPRPAGLNMQEKIVTVINAQKVLVHPRRLTERLRQL